MFMALVKLDLSFSSIVPGWSLHGGRTPIAGALVSHNQIKADHGANFTQGSGGNGGRDFALKLGGGSGNNDASHNRFMIPDWGALRFDLYVPKVGGVSQLSDTNPKKLKVSLIAADGTKLLIDGKEPEILLQAAKGTATAYSEDRWRIGYGETGFETFTIDVPDALRGKVATLRFVLDGGGEVYIDNVFFKSQHLLLGNPTNARTPDAPVPNLQYNNYLIEKPQYSVSFNGDDHIPNWSAWQLNNSWFGTQEAGRDFRRDPKLDTIGIISAKGSDYNPPQATIDPGPTDPNGDFYKFEPGHLAAYSDRKRSAKDNVATNLTINIVPQQSEHNSPLWSGLEDFSRKLVSNQNKEVYVYAGGVGEKNAAVDKASILISGDPTYGSYGVHVPDHLWKVLLILDKPGLGIQEINAGNAQAFAVWTKNELPTLSGVTRPKYLRWNEGGVEIITVSELEKRLNADSSNLARGIQYDFFSTLSKTVQDTLENTTISIPLGANPASSFLLAEIESSEFDLYTPTVDTAVRHSGSTEDAIFKSFGSDVTFGVSQIGISQISPDHRNILEQGISQISPNQIGSAEISVSKIGTSQVSILQVAPSQTSLPQLSSSQIGSTQIAFSHEDFADRGVAQINVAQIDTRQLTGFFNIQPREISLPNIVTLQQIIDTYTSPNSHNFNLQNTTIPTWTEFLTGTTPFNLNIEILDLPTGQLAEANITHFDPTGRPISGTLTLDTDANGLGWFIDSTPWENSEFGTLNSETFFRATLGSAAYGHYDLLTTILHELGHLAGLISGNPTYDSRITNISGTPTFQGNGYSTTLTQDRSHLADPTKLMGTYLAPGMRKLPSPLELQMLADLRNTPTNSSIRLANSISAHQDATPMVGITNGQFDQLLTQWDTRGSIQVTNAAVTLREDDPLLANLSQTFIIPNGAKTLQFTLTDAYLDQSPLNPGDTFEVALLNAQTLQSLVGPISN
jgi:DNA/RNA endonuclease G (NUC1)